MAGAPELGTPEAAAAILNDLYVDLRRKLLVWSELTLQTPQARMGYVGQHLVSAVTGFPGGRSGARGKDLILPGDRHGEIKTCSRVDQLGSCRSCTAKVSAIELSCPACGSTSIERKDDSKWLIAMRSHQELLDLFSSYYFYFVLFDFVDFESATEINARIWRLNPRSKAFAYCMVDYFHNIRSNSDSGAPFNLWPFKLKFDLLRAELIFHAVIREDDSNEIVLFESDDQPAVVEPLPPLTKYAQSGGRDLTADSIHQIGQAVGLNMVSGTKRQLLEQLEIYRSESGVTDGAIASALCDALYGDRIADHLGDLPRNVERPRKAKLL